MPSQMLYRLVSVISEIIGPHRVLTTFNFFIIVVESFPSNVLILACNQLMSRVQSNSSMLEGNRVHISLQLKVVKAVTDDAPSKNHIQDLLHGSAALVLELIVYRES